MWKLKVRWRDGEVETVCGKTIKERSRLKKVILGTKKTHHFIMI